MARIDLLRPAGWLVLLAVCLLLVGCGKSKITRENYDKVQKGMTVEEVEKVLGKGEQESGDAANVAGQFGVALDAPGGSKNVQVYVWESGNKKVTVFFLQGKMVNKTAIGW